MIGGALTLADPALVAPKGAGWPLYPNDLFVHVDGDNPGASNLPIDRAQNSYGTFSIGAGSPSWTAPSGGTPGYWTYDGISEFHSLAMSGTVEVINNPGTMLALYRPVTTTTINDINTWGGPAPYNRLVFSDRCRINNVNGTFITANILGKWFVYVAFFGEPGQPNDQQFFPQTGVASIAGNYNNGDRPKVGRGQIMKLATRLSNYSNINLAQVLMWRRQIDAADILAAITSKWSAIPATLS
jgi:hypothetical protein